MKHSNKPNLPDTELIIGPPGTGKTFELINILEDILQEYDPDRIAFSSFTRTGSYEGRDRAISMFNYSEEDLPFFKTLHSMAFRKMNARTSDMISYTDKIKFGKMLGYNFKTQFTSDLNFNDSIYLFYIDAYRNNPKLGKQIIESNYLNIDDLVVIEKGYREFKKVYNKIDYTDLIEEFIKRDEPLPVDIAIIDEAQDLTTLQWRMIEVAFRNCKKIFIAGDDDQAIYEWSGADVKKFISIEGKIRILNHSYRLPSEILNFSRGITNNIKDRIDKDFEPSEEGGTIKTIGPDLLNAFTYGDTKINPNETYLLLSRNRYYLSKYKDALLKRGIPFNLEGKTFFKPEHIKAINIYSRVQKGNPISSIEKSLLKRFIVPGMNEYKLPWYEVLKIPEDRIEYYRMLIKNKADILSEPKIDIRTIHSVKGAEVDNVFLHLNITNAVSDNLIYNPDSEHRVFYVGATRAKKSLTIVLPDQKLYYDIDFQWIRKHEITNYNRR